MIVLREGATLDERQVKAHCRAHLASYKVPKIVEFARELPRTSSGKIQTIQARIEAVHDHACRTCRSAPRCSSSTTTARSSASARACKEILSRDLSRRGLVVAMSGGIDSSVSRRAERARARRRTRLRPAAARARLLRRQRHARPHAGRAPRHPSRAVRHRADARGHRLLPLARRGDPQRVSRSTATGWKNKIVIAGGLEGRVNHFQLVVQTPAGETRQARLRPQGLPADRRRHELQAAHPQDGRVLPRRPAELRRGRHAEPARVRPGLLREERRRQRRREADRAPVQDAGLRAGAPPGAAGGDLQRHADDRHLQPAAGPGRVLLRAALRADGHRAVGASTTVGRRPSSRRRSASPRRRRSTSTTTSRRSGARRATCIRRRCWSRRCTELAVPRVMSNLSD